MGNRTLSVALASYRSHPASGGQGVYLTYLSRELTRMGHRVDVLSGPPYPHLPDEVGLVKLPSLNLSDDAFPRVDPRRLTSWADWGEWLGALTGGYAEPWAFGRRLAAYLRKHGDRYDLLHDNQSLAYGLLDVRSTGIPVVATVHHPTTIDRDVALEQTRGRIARWRIRRQYHFTSMQKHVGQQLDTLITVSRQAGRDLVEEYGIKETNVRVIPYGIDTELFRPREDVQREPRRLLAVTSARWMRQIKGFGTLLEAFARLASDRDDLNLVVVGSPDASGRTELYLQEKGIADRVAFVEGVSHEKMVRLYCRSTLLVIPSLYEGFGFPAAEAMACATPVVATRVGGLPEVVGEAGVLVPSGDPEAMASAVGSLLEDPRRRRRLGSRGRKRILESFDWARTGQRTVDVYRQLLAGDPDR